MINQLRQAGVVSGALVERLVQACLLKIRHSDFFLYIGFVNAIVIIICSL